MTLASQHEHSASPDVRATCIWTPLCITNLHQALKVKSKWTQMWFLLLYKVQQNVPRACCHAGWMKLPLRGYLGSFSVLCDLRSFLFYMQSKDIRIWLCLLPGLKLLNTTKNKSFIEMQPNNTKIIMTMFEKFSAFFIYISLRDWCSRLSKTTGGETNLHKPDSLLRKARLDSIEMKNICTSVFLLMMNTFSLLVVLVAKQSWWHRRVWTSKKCVCTENIVQKEDKSGFTESKLQRKSQKTVCGYFIKVTH